jgi:hypothetical protein
MLILEASFVILIEDTSQQYAYDRFFNYSHQSWQSSFDDENMFIVQVTG